MTHPDVADAAVIGIESMREATELPRCLSLVGSRMNLIRDIPRAYVVHAKPGAMRDEHKKAIFCRDIESWIQKQVARHKYLRGGKHHCMSLYL